jgi:hypothetical protein
MTHEEREEMLGGAAVLDGSQLLPHRVEQQQPPLLLARHLAQAAGRSR